LTLIRPAGTYTVGLTVKDANKVMTPRVSQTVTIQKASTTITTKVVLKSGADLPPTGVPAGSFVNDTAKVLTQVDSIVISGTVTYNYFTNGGCTGAGAVAGAPSLTPTGLVPNSNQEQPLTPGMYSFQASYSGDGNYNGFIGNCETFTVV
jgi:hypothetical protein